MSHISKNDPDGIVNDTSHPGEIVKDTSHRASRAGVPLSRADLRIWSEKRGFFGGNKFVNTYVERDKKN